MMGAIERLHTVMVSTFLLCSQKATFTGINSHRAQLVKLIIIFVDPILKQVSKI